MRLLIQGSVAWLGPGEPLVPDPAVILDEGRIVYAGRAERAPEADDSIEGDWFLMPAAVDHHVHVGLASPEDILRGGVSAVRDTGWPADDIFPLSFRSGADDFEGPTIAACGPILTAAGGYPARAGWAPPGTALEVRGPEEAGAAVERVALQDPAAIKISLNDEAGPVLDDAELEAIVAATHGLGLEVTAHCQGEGQTERALIAGVDELAHTPWTERLADPLIARMVGRGMRIVSTLDIHSYGSVSPELRRAVDNLFRFHAAGGTVLYGTDLGNGPIPPGIDAREAQHLAAARLTNEEILDAMTSWPLHPGSRADLIALGGDPLEDLEALGDVRLVVRAGRVSFRHGPEDPPQRS